MESYWKAKIAGMHCSSCTELVKNELSAIEGIKDVQVDLASSTAVITWNTGESKEPVSGQAPDQPPDINILRDKISQYGYEVLSLTGSNDLAASAENLSGKASAGSNTGSNTSSNTGSFSKKWLLPFLAAWILFSLFNKLQTSGIIGGAEAYAAAGIGAALLTGFAASLSSCLALVGSFVMALNTVWAGASGRVGVIKANIIFQAGRIAGFALFGGLLGLAGLYITLPAGLFGFLVILLGVFVLALGLGILGIRLPVSNLHVPAGLMRLLDTLKSSTNPASPALLGALTFFLPCGFTLSMQALALASGNFITGALIMGVFAAGTFPVLLSAGLAGAWTKRKGGIISRAAGFIIILFALTAVSSGAGMLGFGTNQALTAAFASGTSESTAAQLTNPDPNMSNNTTNNIQIIETKVMPFSFEPAELKVKAGMSVQWEITGVRASGCTNRIVIPGTRISIPVTNGETQVVSFTPEEAGVIRYSCWMGMVHGTIIVEES